MADYSWHAHETDDALSRLESDRSGLSDEEADRRLERVGPNRLMRSPPVAALTILGDQLTSVVVFLLAAAGGLSLFLADYIEAATIGAVLGLNTAIGFITELRARRAMEALLHFDVPRAVVLRGGHIRLVEAHGLVPGDIIELGAGQAVPADARLVSATDLRASEAALTGESLPSAKQDDVTLDPDTPLAERANMVYKGTTIAAGIGRAVVTATGLSTELGRIGLLVAGVPDERTPLERRLDALGRRLVWLALGVAAIVAGLGAFHGGSLALVIETGLALAVAAVPEALPAVATIALAVGVRRMANRHALVRRLPSVETLGSTTVICTDKTRTLTSGEMSVGRIWTADAEFTLGDGDSTVVADPRLRHVLEVAVRASRHQALDVRNESASTDAVDAAIIAMAARFGIDQRQLTDEWPSLGVVPFSSERKLLATFHERDGRTIACVKGAPRRLVELSDQWLTASGEERLCPASRERLLAVNDGWARQGFRVLGLASGAVAHPVESSLGGLTFVGFVALMDPPASGVTRTLARLRKAGLRTIMVTGDQRLTAETIGRELGLLTTDDQVIDGRELRHLTAEDLRTRVAHVGAFSRVAPQDKLAIVSALQARGEIVAMIGDGVNDAPALKRADVGVAMGLRGTDVAKEAAAIVLQDDRFETIAAAIEEGRVIYDNIRKFVFYLFSCNLAEILVLLIAGLAALLPPLAPLQILWLNLVTDTFPALALAMEPGDPDVMRRPPRDPREPLLSGLFMSSITFYGALLTTATLAAFAWALRWAPAQATTICFMTLALAQIVHLGNARSHTHVLSPGRAFANPYAIAAVLLSILLQLVTVYLHGLRDLLHLTALTASGWAVVVGASAAPALIGQAIRIVRER